MSRAGARFSEVKELLMNCPPENPNRRLNICSGTAAVFRGSIPYESLSSLPTASSSTFERRSPRRRPRRARQAP